MVNLTKRLTGWFCMRPAPDISLCHEVVSPELTPSNGVVIVPDIKVVQGPQASQEEPLMEKVTLTASADTPPSGTDTQLSSQRGLPIELLEIILSFCKPQELVQVSRVNHLCRILTSRLIYREIDVTSAVVTIKCSRTLSSNGNTALLVRKFHVSDGNNDDILLPAFYKSLRKALQNMDNLTALTLLLSGARSHVLVGSKFKLQKFTTACHFDLNMVEFLETQDQITTALFCGQYHYDARLSQSALPNLQSISASPLILAAVVPGRPIQEAELCLSEPWLLHMDVIATVMRILGFSTSTIHTLQFITHLPVSPEMTIAAFNAVPEHLPGLTSLAMHIVKGKVTADLLEGLTIIFSAFSSLRSVMLLSKEDKDALHDDSITGSLVTKWGTACSSLEIISFPNAIWAKNPRLGWITLKELERILLEREKTLEEKEKELHARENEVEEHTISADLVKGIPV